jgi:hypothetical protein
VANLDQPCGAVPHERVLRQRAYKAGATIYPGDIVKLSSDGKLDPVSAGATAAIGVALSYAAADGDAVIVADHPDQLFKIQSDSTNPDAQADIGYNYDIVATAGSSTYKISRMELDDNTGVTDSNYPLKLLAIDARPDNALGAFSDCIVKLNNHQLGGGTGTLGV